MVDKINNPLGDNGDYVAAGNQALDSLYKNASCRRSPAALRTMFGTCETGPKASEASSTATTAAKKQAPAPVRKSLASLSM
jgi:hypothetical protein